MALNALEHLSRTLVRRALERLVIHTPFRFVAFLLLGSGFLWGAFWAAHRVLQHFYAIPLLGPLLTAKFLYMVFLTFFIMLIFSNLVVAISTLYLSDELGLFLSSPIPFPHLLRAKFQETLTQSSWMILLVAPPLFGAYAAVYHAPWWTLLLALLVLLPFFACCTALGILAISPLMRWIPAKRSRQLVMFLGLGALCALTILFRWLQPERLTDPNDLRHFTAFLKDLQAPTAPYLPSTWTVNALLPLLQGRWAGFGVPALKLVGGTLLLVGLAYPFVLRWFYEGWSFAQETSDPRPTTSARLEASSSRPTAPRTWNDSPLSTLLFKEIRIFLRDPLRWPQLLLLLSTAAIYLINMGHLPLHRFQDSEYLNQLKGFVLFLNMGFGAFIIAAVAVRFSFPAVSLEGRSLWLLRCAPLTSFQIVWGKFFMYWPPLLILGIGLVGLACRLLHIDLFMSLLSIGTVAILTTGLVGLSIGLGAVFPKFHAPNAAEIATGWGGLVYMLTAIGYIALTLIIEAGPLYQYYLHRMNHFAPPTGPFFLAAFGVVGLSAAATWMPMAWGIRSLDHLSE